MTEITRYGENFLEKLANLEALRKQEELIRADKSTFHVDGVGKAISLGYEQLRNAAEYTDGNALFQKAITRFLSRLFLLGDEERILGSAEELVVELTLSGYIENDFVNEAMMQDLSDLINVHWNLYKDMNVGVKTKKAWIIEPLASRIEDLFYPYNKKMAVAQLAYEYFATTFKEEVKYFDSIKEAHLTLFVAIAKSLIKATDGTIRVDLLSRYRVSLKNKESYAKFNQELDKIFASSECLEIEKNVSRKGAKFRILLRMVEEDKDLSIFLKSKDKFKSEYENTIKSTYLGIDRLVKNGVIKSVVFLLITKTIIGVAIEVPYDLFFYDHIMWLPLIINLLFPPIYMILLSFTLTMPKSYNYKNLTDEIIKVFYKKESSLLIGRKNKSRGSETLNFIFNIFYWIFFVITIYWCIWLLLKLGFNIVALGIFFIFISTASFLGFRLSRYIREVEVGYGEIDAKTLIRDFLYMPFVMVGSWISDKYSRFNIVSIILDLLIELPLKNILYLIRQWGIFISSKKDQM